MSTGDRVGSRRSYGKIWICCRLGKGHQLYRDRIEASQRNRVVGERQGVALAGQAAGGGDGSRGGIEDLVREDVVSVGIKLDRRSAQRRDLNPQLRAGAAIPVRRDL